MLCPGRLMLYNSNEMPHTNSERENTTPNDDVLRVSKGAFTEGKEFGLALVEAVSRSAVFWPHLLIIGVVAIHTFLDPTSTSFQKFGMIPLFIAMLFLGFGRFFDLARINKWQVPYLVFYHAAVVFGTVFLTDVSTPYTVAWFFAFYLTYLFFGRRGVWRSFAVFTLSIVAKFLFSLTLVHTTKEILNVPASYFAILAVLLMFLSVQKVFEWEHQKLKEVTDRIRQERTKLRTLINNMPESVLVLDEDAVISVSNSAFLTLIDSDTRVDGLDFDQVTTLVDDSGNRLFMRDIVLQARGTIYRTDIYMSYGGDDKARLALIVTPIKGSHLAHLHEGAFVVTIRDITKEKSLDEQRTEFISVLSHELRTPLAIAEANISNAQYIVTHKDDPAKLATSLATAHNDAITLAKMLSDLSVFTEIESDTYEVGEAVQFDAESLVRSVADEFAADAADKGIKLGVEIKTIHTRITGPEDEQRLILRCLVSNAVRYTAKGSVRVVLDGSSKYLLYKVVDSGSGMSTSDKKQIFQKFFRSEDFQTRETSGMGLGLYIADQVARKIQAQLSVKSELGKGSEFSLRVPLK